MRVVLLLAVALFALWRTWGRWKVNMYLIGFLVGTAVVEWFLWTGGSSESPLYHKLYFWSIFATTVIACWIGHGEAKNPFGSIGCVTLGALSIANAPNQVMLLQAAFLSIPAMQCSDSDDVFIRILGKMWGAQATLFAAYAIMEPMNITLWHWIGEWAPATVVVAGMLSLTKSKAIV